jgi:hypothetical protein
MKQLILLAVVEVSESPVPMTLLYPLKVNKPNKCIKGKELFLIHLGQVVIVVMTLIILMLRIGLPDVNLKIKIYETINSTSCC